MEVAGRIIKDIETELARQGGRLHGSIRLNFFNGKYTAYETIAKHLPGDVGKTLKREDKPDD